MFSGAGEGWSPHVYKTDYSIGKCGHCKGESDAHIWEADLLEKYPNEAAPGEDIWEIAGGGSLTAWYEEATEYDILSGLVQKRRYRLQAEWEKTASPFELRKRELKYLIRAREREKASEVMAEVGREMGKAFGKVRDDAILEAMKQVNAEKEGSDELN